MSTQHKMAPKDHLRNAGNRAFQGASLALALISLMILFIYMRNGKSAGFGLWILLPMTTVTIGGSFGGIFYYIMEQLIPENGWKKLLVNILSLAVFIIILWISLVAALNVTGHWD